MENPQSWDRLTASVAAGAGNDAAKLWPFLVAEGLVRDSGATRQAFPQWLQQETARALRQVGPSVASCVAQRLREAGAALPAGATPDPWGAQSKVRWDEFIAGYKVNRKGAEKMTTTPYTEEISRVQPSCFVFLLDQSGSMADRFGRPLAGAEDASKAQGAADALNRALSNIFLRCAKEEGIRNYFEIGIFGYGASVGSLTGQGLMRASDLYTKVAKTERRESSDGRGYLQTEEFLIWVEPRANGGTPMCQALDEAKAVLAPWVSGHSKSYPPIVINITDGAATDGQPDDVRRRARELTSLQNENGASVLLFNIHISDKSDPTVSYLSSAAGLSDPYAQLLFDISSELPGKLVEAAQQGGFKEARLGCRGFVFNGNLADVIRFLDIGTRTSTMVDLRPGS